MPSLKLIAATVCGFAATALAHGLVSSFVTDGKYNQGYICKFSKLARLGARPWDRLPVASLQALSKQQLIEGYYSSGLLLPRKEWRYSSCDRWMVSS